MKEIKPNHYIDTIIYSVDKIIRNLKYELMGKISSLNINVTGEEFVVLDTIKCHNEIYQQQLAEILMKDKSNMTRILKALEQKLYIKRTPGNANGKLVYYISLTQKGKNILKKNMPAMKKYLTDIFANITDEEIDILHSLSKKFQKDLSEITEQN